MMFEVSNCFKFMSPNVQPLSTALMFVGGLLHSFYIMKKRIKKYNRNVKLTENGTKNTLLEIST